MLPRLDKWMKEKGEGSLGDFSDYNIDSGEIVATRKYFDKLSIKNREVGIAVKPVKDGKIKVKFKDKTVKVKPRHMRWIIMRRRKKEEIIEDIMREEKYVKRIIIDENQL